MAQKKANGKLTVSLSELSQEIDLKGYLGRKPTAKEKQLFADLAVDTIENRTLDGDNINGQQFSVTAPYSKEYAQSKGVTTDSVDLFLKGDMLESMGRRKSKEKTSSVFIQMKKGLETKKAYNHMTKKSDANPLPKREFFGVTDQEARTIANEIKDKEIDKKKTSLAELKVALDLLDIEQVE